MIQLNKNDELARGTNRACFIHPFDDNKCIKITISNDSSESEKEIEYYKFLEKKNISWEYISKYYGQVKTNLGKGEVFDLIKDFDGSVSRTLSSYLQNDEETKLIANPFPLLQILKNYTLKEGVVVKDLNTKNMLYQKVSDNESRLVLIDGVVNNDFLPFSKYINYFTIKKILRLWQRFEESLPKKYSFNKYFLGLIFPLK